MPTVNIKQEDYEFLKDLQHELNTQTTDGNAEPVFWGVMEEDERLTVEGQGKPKITYDDGAWTLEKAVEEIKEYLETDGTDEQKLDWGCIDHDDPYEVCDYMENILKWQHIGMVIWTEPYNKLCTYTGAFLTKRAVKKYIEKYSYNHNNPRSYAMTAIRNPEFERLISILRTIPLDEEGEIGK